MHIALLAAVAASTLAAAPPAPQPKGNAYDHPPKVCVVTFKSASGRASQAETDVVGARYVPLSIAVKLEKRTDDVSDIYTYGPGRYTGPGVDFNYDGDSTKRTCNYLADLADGEDDWDD